MSLARKQVALSGFLGALMLLLAMLVLTFLGQPTFAAGEDGTRDVITPTTMSSGGVTQTLSAASGDGHKFANTGEEFIVVANDYTSSVTLTLVTGGTVAGLDIEDVDVVISAGQTKLIGPLPKSVFNQPGGSDFNKIYLNWNAAVTGTVANSVTLAVYKLR